MAQRRGRAVGILPAAVAVAVAAALTGCAGGEDASDSATGDSGPTRTVESTRTEAADPSVAAAEGAGCEPGTAPADGRWYGTVVSLTPDVLELDVACWFIGEDAVMAADEDGAESPPPDDYYVRDTDDEVSTLAVGPNATVVMFPTGSPEQQEGTVPELIDVAESRDGYPFGVWVEVAGGAVVSIQEQWVP